MSNFIGIKNPDGEWLELGNAELSFEIESPVFKFDTIPAEKSFDFNLPITPNNMKYLNYPNRVANTEVFNRRLEGYSLYYGGQLYAVGSLYVLESTTQNIRVSFQTAVARIAKWYDYTLDEFNLGGGWTLPGLVYSTALSNFMYNHNNGAPGYGYNFTFPVYKNDNQSIFPYVNHWDQLNTGYNMVDLSYKISPFFYLHFVLQELEPFLGMQHFGSFIDDAELRRLVIYSPITCEDVNIFASRFLPPIKIRDFYKHLAKLFCMSYHFSRTDNRVDIKFFKDIYNSTDVVDYTAKVNPNSTFKFVEEKGVSLLIENDAGDAKVTQSDYRFYNGDKPYSEIKTEISYPKNADFTEPFSTPSVNVSFRCPFVEQNWDYPLVDGSKPSFNLRLLFNRGFPLNSHGSGYPYAAYNDKAWNNVTIPGTNYTLEWDGTKGLYNNFWKQYAEFITTTRIAIFKAQFSLTDILEFDFTKKIRIKSNEYLCKKLKYKVTKHGITEGEMELYRL